MFRAKAIPAIAALVGGLAIVAVVALQHRADNARQAQLTLQTVRTHLDDLQMAPFKSAGSAAGSRAFARAQIGSHVRAIDQMLGQLSHESPPAQLGRLKPILESNRRVLEHIFRIGATTGTYGRRADALAAVAARHAAAATRLLRTATLDYSHRATDAATQAARGGAAVIVILILAFAFYYRRSVRVAGQNKRLLELSRNEAETDALTGLSNRRALMADLERMASGSGSTAAHVLALFDLDGFKHYNDSFGHPAGDVMLTRLAERLDASLDGKGTAYRLGGDEFCLLASVSPHEAGGAAQRGANALRETGEGFDIGCSYGVVTVPGETNSASEALRMADQRMYEQKAGRSSATRQSADVLLQVLSERSAGLGEHTDRVATLAVWTAQALGFTESGQKRIRLASELHDIGKSGVPDAILNKTGRLDPAEWEFMQRHTIIGERIVLAAPALAPVARVVRSSHEAFDGSGYPDGLKGEQIPVGSRVIAVCDAFDAMTSGRPYREKMPAQEALDELHRCSGSQFDPDVVRAFCPLVLELEDHGALNLIPESPNGTGASSSRLAPVPHP